MNDQHRHPDRPHDDTDAAHDTEARMNEIRERVEHDEYEIDADAVARALVARLLAGRTAEPGEGESRG